MTNTTLCLCNGESLTAAELGRLKAEFGGAFVASDGCLLLSAYDDTWFLLNRFGGHLETGDYPTATYRALPDMVQGLQMVRPILREFIGAARAQKIRWCERTAEFG